MILLSTSASFRQNKKFADFGEFLYFDAVKLWTNEHQGVLLYALSIHSVRRVQHFFIRAL